MAGWAGGRARTREAPLVVVDVAVWQPGRIMDGGYWLGGM